MYKYLDITRTFVKHKTIRQFRTIAVLVLIPLAYLMTPDKSLEFYALLASGLFALALDSFRKKRPSINHKPTILDWSQMILINLFLSGIIGFNGGPVSVLMLLYFIPIFTAAYEFTIPIALMNALPLGIFTLIGFPLYLKSPASGALSLILLATILMMLVLLAVFARIDRHYHQKIQRLLIKDELTALYNRRFLKNEVLAKIKARRPFALIIMDINFFKYFNDQWGHPAGDLLLISFGRVLKEVVRSNDYVIRYSGDEFILLLDPATQEDVDNSIERLTLLLDEHEFTGEECFPNHKLTISYGSVLYEGESASFHNLLVQADQALYDFKNAHKKKHAKGFTKNG